MLREHLILPGGFKNVFQNDRATGFQVAVRTAYYRGVYLSLVEGYEVAVDGETFQNDRITFTVGENPIPSTNWLRQRRATGRTGNPRFSP